MGQGLGLGLGPGLDNFSNLQKIGINVVGDYKYGNWYGNSSKSGYETFLEVTQNISDIIDVIRVNYESRKFIECKHAYCLKTRDIGFHAFGRCFEIEIDNGNEKFNFIRVDIKMSVFIFITLPYTFFNGVQSSRIQVNTDETLQLEASYEILQTNFDETCKKYSWKYDQSFDACQLEAFNRKIVTNMNCSVPFMFNPNRTIDVCQNLTVAKKAWKFYLDHTWKILPECPVPCVNMIPTFGYPNIGKGGFRGSKGTVFLLFKDLVKVTEDFVSYDLLRFI